MDYSTRTYMQHNAGHNAREPGQYRRLQLCFGTERCCTAIIAAVVPAEPTGVIQPVFAIMIIHSLLHTSIGIVDLISAEAVLSPEVGGKHVL
jgi:hypothetical protein